MKYSGEVYDCIHAFITRNRWFETLHNAYFENKICIEKHHPERARQTLNAKNIIGYEILLRTKILSVNGREVGGSLNYFTHDSMYAIKRKSYDNQEALERGIIRVTEKFKEENPEGSRKDPY